MGGPDRRPGKGIQAAALVALTAELVSCSSSKPNTSPSTSPSRTVATAPGATQSGEATPTVSGSAGTPRPDRSTPTPLQTAGLPVIDCTHPTKDALKGAKSPSGLTSIYVKADATHQAFAVTDVDDPNAE